MSNLKITRETYAQIASVYAQAHVAREEMSAHIKKFVGLLPPQGEVLDVGCGPGMDSAVLSAHNLIPFGLDFSYEMMHTGRKEHQIRVPFVQADMRRLPLAAQLDGVWACASLLHLNREDMLPTLQEFRRVLKPNGILYCSVKLGDGEKWTETAYDQPLPRFFTYWRSETLDPLLETAAFQIIDGWEDEGKRDRWLVRFARKEEPKS